MYLLYLGDSASVENRNEDYLVLGGVSLFEAQVNWLTTELDKLAERIDPKDPQAIEFHASEIFSGRAAPWDAMQRNENLAEAPLFIKSHVSRSVQLADHIAYAVFRRYNAGDTTYFDIIAHKFHAVEGVVHGLSHKQNINRDCMCLACASRALSNRRPATARAF